MVENVILVSPADEPIGEMEKLQAHLEGRLHRAFSVLIYDAEGKMLLQQRAAGKYHSPNLWTNACCGHPRPNEATQAAAERRLNEEMGFTLPLTHSFTFTYRAEFANGLIENEIDHVFTATYTGAIPFNTDEVQAVKWLTIDEIKSEITQHPTTFTAWFKLIMERL